MLLALALLWLGISAAYADGIEVRKAEAHLSNGSYQLSADFNISLNFLVEQALTRGVPLYFVSEFTLTRPRWYWLDETVVQSEQVTKLSYNSLTRQYRITRGALFQNFVSLDAALNIIGHQSAEPVQVTPPRKDSGYMGYITGLFKKKDGNHIASARLHLDITQLPKPLQVNALASDEWNLDSGWYQWIVSPDTAARNRDE